VSRWLMKTLLKPLAIPVVSIATLAPAKAGDTVPAKFQGTWCIDESAPEVQPSKAEPTPSLFIYKRANKCNAHEPEDHMVLRSDRLLFTDVIECKFLEIVSIPRHGTHRLKFWCKNNQFKDRTWIYEIWISAPSRNQLAIQEVKENK
jgi:hypothetical protein